MKKIALFDFDNTIYNGYTYEDFINLCSKNILKDDKFQTKVKQIKEKYNDYNLITLGIAEIV